MANREPWLNILQFTIDDKPDEPMVDLRYWIDTKVGPRPTKKGIAFPQKNIVKLIIALQNVQQQINTAAAKRELLRNAAE